MVLDPARARLRPAPPGPTGVTSSGSIGSPATAAASRRAGRSRRSSSTSFAVEPERRVAIELEAVQGLATDAYHAVLVRVDGDARGGRPADDVRRGELPVVDRDATRRSAAAGSGRLVTRLAVADALADGSRWTYLGVFEENDDRPATVRVARVRDDRRRRRRTCCSGHDRAAADRARPRRGVARRGCRRPRDPRDDLGDRRPRADPGRPRGVDRRREPPRRPAPRRPRRRACGAADRTTRPSRSPSRRRRAAWPPRSPATAKGPSGATWPWRDGLERAIGPGRRPGSPSAGSAAARSARRSSFCSAPPPGRT